MTIKQSDILPYAPTQYLSDQEELNAVRDFLQNKKRLGTLGVIAATACVPEGMLAEWCDDATKIPDYTIIYKVADVMRRSYPARL